MPRVRLNVRDHVERRGVVCIHSRRVMMQLQIQMPLLNTKPESIRVRGQIAAICVRGGHRAARFYERPTYREFCYVRHEWMPGMRNDGVQPL